MRAILLEKDFEQNLNKSFKSSAEWYSFPFLYLPGIYAENMVFGGSILTDAIFENASMAGSKFLSSNLARTIEDDIFQNVDLTNVDLYQSNIGNHLLYHLSCGGL